LLAAWATEQFELRGQVAELAEQSGHRVALFSIAAFLLVGLALLLFVNEKRGRDAARAVSEDAVSGE
jgi:hypothetical protein